MFPCDFRSQYFFHILRNAIVLYEWGQYWGFPVDGPYYDSCDSLTYLTTLVPPQVERWYLDAGPSAFSLSASSVLIIEALLWSSTTAYTRWTSLGRSRHPPALSWCKVTPPGGPLPIDVHFKLITSEPPLAGSLSLLLCFFSSVLGGAQGVLWCYRYRISLFLCTRWRCGLAWKSGSIIFPP